MADFGINITAVVPPILSYVDGKVFCNVGTGCEAFDTETGEVLKAWTTTVDNEAWSPDPGFNLDNLGFRVRT